MKKVFVTLLMLMMVVGLFAVADTAKVTATVGDFNQAWFSTEENSTGPESNVVVVMKNENSETKEWEEGPLTENSKGTVYVHVKTNVIAGCKVDITGTALTLTSTNGVDSSNTIAIKVSDGSTDVKFVDAATSSQTAPDEKISGSEVLTLTLVPEKIEQGRGTANKKLTISIDGTSSDTTKPFNLVPAGSYVAWLVLDYATNA